MEVEFFNLVRVELIKINYIGLRILSGITLIISFIFSSKINLASEIQRKDLALFRVTCTLGMGCMDIWGSTKLGTDFCKDLTVPVLLSWLGKRAFSLC